MVRQRELFRVRPKNATAEQALRLREAGMTWDAIGQFWGGITGQAVINVVKRAQKQAEKSKQETGG